MFICSITGQVYWGRFIKIYKGKLGFFLGCDTPWVSSSSLFWNGYVWRGIRSNTMLICVWSSNRGEWAYMTFSMSSSFLFRGEISALSYLGLPILWF